MSIGVINYNGKLYRAELYYNRRGTIYNEDSMEFFHNVNNKLYKLPKKDAILNLDHNSFLTNSTEKASFGLNKPIQYYQQWEKTPNFGALINKDTISSDEVYVNPAKGFLAIGENISTAHFLNSGGSIYESTVSVCCEIVKTNDWKDIFGFGGSSAVHRCEYGGGSMHYYSEGGYHLELCPLLTGFNTFTMTINGSRGEVKCWVNGKYIGSTGTRSGSLGQDLYINYSRAQNASLSAKYRSVRWWEGILDDSIGETCAALDGTLGKPIQ